MSHRARNAEATLSTLRNGAAVAIVLLIPTHLLPTHYKPTSPPLSLGEIEKLQDELELRAKDVAEVVDKLGTWGSWVATIKVTWARSLALTSPTTSPSITTIASSTASTVRGHQRCTSAPPSVDPVR